MFAQLAATNSCSPTPGLTSTKLTLCTWIGRIFYLNPSKSICIMVDWSAAKYTINVYLPTGPVVVLYKVMCAFWFVDNLILDGMITCLN